MLVCIVLNSVKNCYLVGAFMEPGNANRESVPQQSFSEISASDHSASVSLQDCCSIDRLLRQVSDYYLFKRNFILLNLVSR